MCSTGRGRLADVRGIAEVADQELVWIQPAARKREHELRAGDELVATLRFQRGTLADAEADIAAFHPRWTGGGSLEVADGNALKLASANFWQSEWVRLDKDQPVVRFKGRHGIVKAKGAVEVQAGAGERPDLPLLILLGWYLILLHADDAAAATSASSVAVISST